MIKPKIKTKQPSPSPAHITSPQTVTTNNHHHQQPSPQTTITTNNRHHKQPSPQTTVTTNNHHHKQPSPPTPTPNANPIKNPKRDAHTFAFDPARKTGEYVSADIIIKPGGEWEWKREWNGGRAEPPNRSEREGRSPPCAIRGQGDTP